MNSKSILITGVTGFAGSHLADHLLATEPEAQLWGARRPNARMRNVHHCAARIRWVDADVTDPYSMRALLERSQPSEIYHLAALSWVSPSWSMPAAYMQVNAIGTIHLLEAMRQTGLTDSRVLLSGSPEEFGDVRPEDLPLTERSPLHPVNPYAASKAAQEAVALSYGASYGIPIIRTRAFNHEGPRRDIHGANAWFAYSIARIEAGLDPPLLRVGNLEAHRNFTDVRDMAQAYDLALRHGLPGELYLIGSDHVHTMHECLETLLSLSSRRDIRWEVDPERVRPTELRHLVADCSRFRSLTGWAPRYSFEETLAGVLDYWRTFVREGHY